MTAPFILGKTSYIKSPLNYTGGKHKLLGQILPLFPCDIKYFVDIFSGGLNVGINVNSSRVIANDNCTPIIDLYSYFKAEPLAKIINQIDSIIDKYELSRTSELGYEFYGTTSIDGVSKYNKNKYIKLREDYNRLRDPIMFYVLVVYAFNNQIRFNKNGDFNLPVNKRDFTSSMRQNLIKFITQIQTKKIDFVSKDYRDINIPKEAFIYLDPPYLASTATYNENDGWNEKKELELLEFINGINKAGQKFALSNVFHNKGRANNILIEWSKKYNVNFLNHSYSNSSYQSKNKTDKTIEVLITNY